MHHTWNCMHFYKLLVIRRQKNLRSFPLDFPLDFLHLHISCNINIEGAILDPNLVENLISLSTLFALFSTLALSLCALESCRWHRVRTQALLGTHTQLQRTYKASERGRTHDCTHTHTNEYTCKGDYIARQCLFSNSLFAMKGGIQRGMWNDSVWITVEWGNLSRSASRKNWLL